MIDPRLLPQRGQLLKVTVGGTTTSSHVIPGSICNFLQHWCAQPAPSPQMNQQHNKFTTLRGIALNRSLGPSSSLLDSSHRSRGAPAPATPAHESTAMANA